jgi:CDP-2,3-bis-(O-geranylgeranyl)-sn-glycerol synthase
VSVLDQLLFCFLLFGPAGWANIAPVLAAKIKFLDWLDKPIDFGRTLRGHRLFGQHKTFRGFVVGFIACVPVVYFQSYLFSEIGTLNIQAVSTGYFNVNSIVLAAVFSFGALGGDAIKSFFKRQSNIKPGKAWIPFDQIDFVLGGLLVLNLVLSLSTAQNLIIGVTYFLLHPISTVIGWFLKLKDSPI